MTMLMTITTNLDEVRSRLSGLEKQVNFAASKALNDTARRCAQVTHGTRSSPQRLLGQWEDSP